MKKLIVWAVAMPLLGALLLPGTSSAQSTAVWCYAFNTNLSIGMTGPEVTALQTALLDDGENALVTGYFGKITLAAVVAFQDKYASVILNPNGLSNGTGYVGVSTRAELNSLYECQSSVPPPTSDVPPQILSLSPSSGPIGTEVTLTGNGLTDPNNDYFVEINFAQGSAQIGPLIPSNDGKTLQFNIPSTLEIRCSPGSASGVGVPAEVPACTQSLAITPGDALSVSVLITTEANGTSGAAAFTVTGSTSTSSPPVISSIDPTLESSGFPVTIMGVNFGASNTVLMNGYIAATNIPSDGTSLTFDVPSVLTPNCPPSSSGTPVACPTYAMLVASGTTYSVGVVTNGVASNNAPLSIPSSSSLLQGQPDSLGVVRQAVTNDGFGNPVPYFSDTISDAGAVQKIYADMLALPVAPQGPLNCPNESYANYFMVFYDGIRGVAEVHYNPTGCAIIALSDGQDLWNLQRGGNPFNTDLEQVLGISSSSFLLGNPNPGSP